MSNVPLTIERVDAWSAIRTSRKKHRSEMANAASRESSISLQILLRPAPGQIGLPGTRPSPVGIVHQINRLLPDFGKSIATGGPAAPSSHSRPGTRPASCKDLAQHRRLDEDGRSHVEPESPAHTPARPFRPATDFFSNTVHADVLAQPAYTPPSKSRQARLPMMATRDLFHSLTSSACASHRCSPDAHPPSRSPASSAA